MNLVPALFAGLVSLAAPEAAPTADPPDLAAPGSESSDQHVRARLVSEHAGLVPGSTAMFGLVFEIEPQWHIYWEGRNDTGTAPKATFTLPEGFKAEPWLWPTPKRYVSPGDILDHVYEDRVTLLVPVKIPDDAKPGTKVELAAKVNWLVCSSLCVPESTEVSLTLPVVEKGAVPEKTSDAPLFETTRKRLAKKFEPDAKDPPFKVEVGATSATIRAPGAKSLLFMPLNNCSALSDILKDGEKKGENLKVGFDRKAKSPKRLQGIVQIRTSETESTYHLIDMTEASNAVK